MIRTLFLVPLLFAPIVGFAQADCRLAAGSYQNLLKCAEDRSPEIQNARLELEAAKNGVRAAGQWKNPELAAQSFRGKIGGDQRAETDLSLGVPVELGGKISARKEVAQGGVDLAEANLYRARTKVRSEVFLKLHRLRQLMHEREIIDESVKTFSKLIGQYNKRPGLSPEQQISTSVYQLALGDYQLKRNLNIEEEFALDSYFKFAAGVGVDVLSKAMPLAPKKWPTFTPAGKGAPSPQQLALRADVKTAKAQLSVAQSEAWPTLTVGPSVKMVEEMGRSDQMIGFNLSLPVPMFNINGGARAAASANVKSAEAREQFGLRQQDLLREELLKVYETSIKFLTESLSHEEIEKRHDAADKMFSRGIVPSALVIEAHRTSFDLERARHEREIRAFEALLALYAIDGTMLEVSL